MLSATKLRRLAFCAFIALDIEDTKFFNSCKLLHWPNLQRRYRAQPSVRN